MTTRAAKRVTDINLAIFDVIDEVSVGVCIPIVISWWGPGPIPNGHILADAEEHEMNSLVCHPDQEDTLVSSLPSTGWIKLLLSCTNPQVVADVYSTSGELYTWISLNQTTSRSQYKPLNLFLGFRDSICVEYTVL